MNLGSASLGSGFAGQQGSLGPYQQAAGFGAPGFSQNPLSAFNITGTTGPLQSGVPGFTVPPAVTVPPGSGFFGAAPPAQVPDPLAAAGQPAFAPNPSPSGVHPQLGAPASPFLSPGYMAAQATGPSSGAPGSNAGALQQQTKNYAADKERIKQKLELFARAKLLTSGLAGNASADGNQSKAVMSEAIKIIEDGKLETAHVFALNTQAAPSDVANLKEILADKVRILERELASLEEDERKHDPIYLLGVVKSDHAELLDKFSHFMTKQDTQQRALSHMSSEIKNLGGKVDQVGEAAMVGALAAVSGAHALGSLSDQQVHNGTKVLYEIASGQTTNMLKTVLGSQQALTGETMSTLFGSTKKNTKDSVLQNNVNIPTVAETFNEEQRGIANDCFAVCSALISKSTAGVSLTDMAQWNKYSADDSSIVWKAYLAYRMVSAMEPSASEILELSRFKSTFKDSAAIGVYANLFMVTTPFPG